MNSPSSKFNLLWLFLAGILSMFAFAPYHKSIFIIISLLILLWIYEESLSKSRKMHLYLGIACFAMGYFSAQLYWIFYSLNYIIKTGFIVAVIAQFAFSAVMAFFIGLAFFIFGHVRTKSIEVNYLFLFPSCWVLGEWLRGWVLTGFPWCDIGYTQISNHLLSGYFPVLGIYGVSWLTLSVIGFLFIVIYKRQNLLGNAPQITRGLRLSIVYFMLLAIIGYGLNNQQYTKPYGKQIKVALVQGNIDQETKWDSSKFLRNLDMYAKIIARTKADLIILPETAFPIFENNLPPYYLHDITALAKANGAELVIGMPQIINSAGDYASAAVEVSKPGHPYYAKTHLVPFGEFTPFPQLWGGLYHLFGLPMVGFSGGGLNQAPFVLANQKIAFNICYENGFANELVARAANATIMANISDMVWFGNTHAKDEHLQLSQARALENQRYFIQGTNTGSSAIIKPNGEIQSRLPDFESGVLIDYVQGVIGTTPYQRYANYPVIGGILFLLLLAIMVKIVLFYRHKYKHSHQV